MPKGGGGGGGGHGGGGGRGGRGRGGGGAITTEAGAKAKINQMGGIASDKLNDLRDNSLIDVMNYLPEGSVIVGEGAYAFTVKTPLGEAIRVQVGSTLNERVNISVVLQAKKTLTVGNNLVEHLEYIPQIARSLSFTERAQGEANIINRLPHGYYPSDLHTGNYGRRANGEWVVFDPGAIVKD